jgi:hypothetical protein
VVQEIWHRAKSRTYGGRNSSKQIQQDATNLFDAAVEDFKILADYLDQQGWSTTEIQQLWDDLDSARKQFFTTGLVQVGNLK